MRYRFQIRSMNANGDELWASMQFITESSGDVSMKVHWGSADEAEAFKEGTVGAFMTEGLLKQAHALDPFDPLFRNVSRVYIFGEEA